jgi:hypothetical protein
MARAAPLALALAVLGAGCQSPKGSCDVDTDCAAHEKCDQGVCIRVPDLGGNGSGGGTLPASFTPVVWSTLETAAGASFSADSAGADAVSGDVFVAGALAGPFDPWALSTGGFAARLGGGGGALAWAVPFPTFSHGALRTAVAPDGGILYAGTAYDPTVVGTDIYTPPPMGSLVVGRLDASGNPIWTRAVDDTNATAALAPASLASRGGVGDLLIAGTGSGDFGCGADTGGATFAAALAFADGTCLWSRGFTTSTVTDLEPRDAGDAVLAGLCTPTGASFDPGGGSSCSTGLFLAVLSGADGSTVWSRVSSGTGSVTAVRDLAVAPSGGIALIGDATGPVSFGGATVDFGTAEGSFAAIYGPTGAPGLVVRPIEAPYAPLPDAAAFARGAYDRNGKLWVTGRFYGQPTLGGVLFPPCRTPACAVAAFLARIEVDGRVGSFLPIRAAAVGTDQAAFVDDFALFATTGTLAYTLRFTGAATVGTTSWSTAEAGLGVLRIVP